MNPSRGPPYSNSSTTPYNQVNSGEGTASGYVTSQADTNSLPAAENHNLFYMYKDNMAIAPLSMERNPFQTQTQTSNSYHQANLRGSVSLVPDSTQYAPQCSNDRGNTTMFEDGQTSSNSNTFDFFEPSSTSTPSNVDSSVTPEPATDTRASERAQCPNRDCTSSFARSRDVPRHLDLKHNGQMIYCLVQGCGYSNARYDKLQGHLRKIHGIETAERRA